MLNTAHAAPETNKFDEVTAEGDKTEELHVEQQNAVNTALIARKYIEENHTAFKKISVPVETERAETEEQNYAGSAALTALKTAKTDELDARDKFEEVDVLKQNADDDNTHTGFIIITNKPNVSEKTAAGFNHTKHI